MQKYFSKKKLLNVNLVDADGSFITADMIQIEVSYHYKTLKN